MAELSLQRLGAGIRVVSHQVELAEVGVRSLSNGRFAFVFAARP